MDYEFGDILDARKAPKPLGHFIIVLGKTRGAEVMYYLITSRVYTVFTDILEFFNDCLSRKDAHFLRKFNKEKGKDKIFSHGSLIDALFLDKNIYSLSLDTDSMAVVNNDPYLIDKQVLNRLKAEESIFIKDKLSKVDMHKLISIIRYSKNVSPDKKNQISANFNKI